MEFSSETFPLVSKPYYEKISFNGLPKRNVDFFSFDKYEDFDSLEKNITLNEDVNNKEGLDNNQKDVN